MFVLTIKLALRTHEGIGTGTTGTGEPTAALSSQDPIIELFTKRLGRGERPNVGSPYPQAEASPPSCDAPPLTGLEQTTELDVLEGTSSLIDRVDF